MDFVWETAVLVVLVPFARWRLPLVAVRRLVSTLLLLIHLLRLYTASTSLPRTRFTLGSLLLSELAYRARQPTGAGAADVKHVAQDNADMRQLS